MEKDLLLCYAGCLMDNVWCAHNEATHGAPVPSFVEISSRVSRLFQLSRSSLYPAPPPQETHW